MLVRFVSEEIVQFLFFGRITVAHILLNNGYLVFPWLKSGPDSFQPRFEGSSDGFQPLLVLLKQINMFGFFDNLQRRISFGTSHVNKNLSRYVLIIIEIMVCGALVLLYHQRPVILLDFMGRCCSLEVQAFTILL